MKNIKTICVYCGASLGKEAEFKAAAQALGKSIADHKLRLVYGGGTNGLMGVVSAAVKDNGGEVVGVIPEFLLKYEASEGTLEHLDELHVVEDMHTRKRMMFEQADAFVTLPGGIGTLEEVIEMMTWAQIGQHTKPIVLANISNFWEPLTTLLDHMIDSGFLKNDYGGRPLVIADPDEIVPTILDFSSSKRANVAVVSKH